MLNVKLYGDILKVKLFRLGGFIVKKKNNSNVLINNECKLLLFKDLFYEYLFIDPIYSLYQLVNVFKFYTDLIIYKKKSIICSLIDRNFFFMSSYSLTVSNFFLFSNSLGGMFTNHLGSLLSLLSNKQDIRLELPSLGIIFNSKWNLSVFKEFFDLGIPTLGLVGPSNKINLNYVTYPLYFQYNIYILYFFLRLFFKILYINKFKSCLG